MFKTIRYILPLLFLYQVIEVVYWKIKLNYWNLQIISWAIFYTFLVLEVLQSQMLYNLNLETELCAYYNSVFNSF